MLVLLENGGKYYEFVIRMSDCYTENVDYKLRIV